MRARTTAGPSSPLGALWIRLGSPARLPTLAYMDPAEALAHLGGVSDRSSLLRLTTRHELEEAVDARVISHTGRDSYALPSISKALKLAHASRGVLCLTSAAIALGWATKSEPARPQICYPKDRRLSTGWRRQVESHWADLDPAEVDGLCTGPGKTLEMCGRTLPFDEALAIADSALRHGEHAALAALANATGRGAGRLKRVVAAASPLAANPFESVLRAIAAEVPGLELRPQVRVRHYRPDLVDDALGIIAEADSFEWHGSRSALHRDATRYNDLTTSGWLVLRFSWEQVMHDPAAVRRSLEAAVAQQRTKRPILRRNAR